MGDFWGRNRFSSSGSGCSRQPCLGAVGASEGGLWNRWEVLAMSINQSQPRMRLRPILLHSRFHQKPAGSPVFSGCSVLASLRRVLQVAREACYTPEPRICAESSPSFGFLSPFFPLTKTTTCRNVRYLVSTTKASSATARRACARVHPPLTARLPPGESNEPNKFEQRLDPAKPLLKAQLR